VGHKLLRKFSWSKTGATFVDCSKYSVGPKKYALIYKF